MAFTLNITQDPVTVTVDLTDLDTPFIQRTYGDSWCQVTSGTPEGTSTMREAEVSENYALALKQFEEAKARLDALKHFSSIIFEKFLEDNDFAQD